MVKGFNTNQDENPIEYFENNHKEAVMSFLKDYLSSKVEDKITEWKELQIIDENNNH